VSRRAPAPESASLVARAVDTLSGLDAVARVLVALPPGTSSPGPSRPLPLRGGLIAALEDAVAGAGSSDVLLIHDPCRSSVDAGVFTRMLRELRGERSAAVVAAVPVTDTLKEVDDRRRIVGTVDRGAMWQLQTPQAYRLETLAGVLAKARDEGVTDEMVRTDPGLLPSLVDGAVRIVPLPRDSVVLTGGYPPSIKASARSRSTG
jgi:hypothetical protein